MPYEHFAIIIVIVPLIFSFLVVLLGWFRKGLCYPLTMVALLVSFIISLGILDSVMTRGTIHYHVGGWAPPWGIELVVDYFNAFMLVMLTFIALLTGIYAKKSVQQELPEKIVPFYALFLLLVTGVIGITVTGDLFNLFVFLEILALSSYALPLHAWQPDAYTYAPSTVSVIISTVVAKTAVYALIRVIFSVFTVDFITLYVSILDIICWISAIAMIYGSIYAIRQFNLKRMLAYSSIANVGYIMLGVGLCTSTSLGLTPALMHILNDTLMKGCMFMAACAFIYKAGLWDIRDFTGLGRKMPYTSFAFILASLAMIGMPPGVGFVTKLYLILAALDAGQYAFVAVIFFSTLLMITYFWRVIEIMYIKVEEGEGSEKESAISIDETSMGMLIPGLILAFLCFGIGILWLTDIPSPILNAINSGFGLGVIP
jgi:formate hydrogenlyase subunit 3/multisubunit Na+/H+ antiporter MnhD subunit